MVNSASSQVAILAKAVSVSLSRAISERPGYVIQSTGEIAACNDKRVKDSPDGEYHCRAHQAGLDAGQTLRLFVQPKGV